MGRLLVRDSTPRLSWERAMTGTFSSRAMPFSPLVILESSWTRLSGVVPSMSWR